MSDEIQQTSPRDIHQLIGLDTYQGMTDEEISIIINFRANVIASTLLAEYSDATIIEQQEHYLELAREAKEQAQANFKAACGTISFQTIELEE